jgi:hypothetical protein
MLSVREVRTRRCFETMKHRKAKTNPFPQTGWHGRLSGFRDLQSVMLLVEAPVLSLSKDALCNPTPAPTRITRQRVGEDFT